MGWYELIDDERYAEDSEYRDYIEYMGDKHPEYFEKLYKEYQINEFLQNINKLHTYSRKGQKLKNKLGLRKNQRVTSYCRKKILNRRTNIYIKRNRIYCEIDNIKIVINKESLTIADVCFIDKKEAINA